MTRRVVGTVLSACLLGILVLLVPTALAVNAKNQHLDLLEMQRLAALSAHGLSTSGLAGWTPPADSGDHQYAVYDSGDRLVSGNGPPLADPTVQQARSEGMTAQLVGDQIVAAASLDGSERNGWVARVSEPVREATSRSVWEMAGLLGIAVVAVGVASGAGWFLVRRLLRPLAMLRQSVSEAGSGALVTSVPHTGLPEVDQVGDALVASHLLVLQTLTREREFAADVSHQLRTPLAAVITALEAERLHPRADRNAVVDESLTALRRLQVMVEQLLSLRRGEAVKSETSLYAVTKDAVERWRPRFAEARRPLRLTGSEPGAIHATPAALVQILDVLLDNAVRHGGGGTTVSVEPTRGGIMLAVTDQGPGPTNPESLFERHDPHASGSGIGLALARDLAAVEGARLRFAGREPTRFEVLFPVAASRPAAPDT